MKAFILTLAITGFGVYDAFSFDYKRQALLAEANSVSTRKPPKRAPVPSQEDIDLAMELYSIRSHKHVVGPRYNKSLHDRGTTQGTIDSPIRIVEIGPSAFSSWGMLGSTLAHEIEVHANQSFIKIAAQDAVGPGNSGTLEAETEAYNYELKCKDRFGLSKTEVWLIQETLKEYYGPARK